MNKNAQGKESHANDAYCKFHCKFKFSIDAHTPGRNERLRDRISIDLSRA